jgi:deoxycytidine triphosphate deaminase
MRILDADATSGHVDGLVHLETQRAPSGLDLTVGGVARITGPGRLDFGGSEFAPAPTGELSPAPASPDDDYGWWELDPGSYVVRYNETLELDDGQVALVHPLPRLLGAGASHPAFVADADGERLEVLLTVGEGGCGLKENCRVSRLLVAEG